MTRTHRSIAGTRVEPLGAMRSDPACESEHAEHLGILCDIIVLAAPMMRSKLMLHSDPVMGSYLPPRLVCLLLAPMSLLCNDGPLPCLQDHDFVLR